MARLPYLLKDTVMRSKARREVRPPRRKQRASLGLIRGGKKLAAFIFDDPAQFKKVYGLKQELGLFRLNGQICGREETIVARIAEREARAVETAA
jgi:hypothetical protein